ncbi:ATP-binding protein [Companilactobacillus jidongensis]|uniref:ATP-binding protein n=1 Tax=Companilactobacillus jidongensis TaxID=2486006 RepID=UPI0013DE743B|nr:AAA family ATPase [Companilactobacillus jidongensis]
MKLTKVKIYGFGKWSDVEWNFNRDYQVIYGNNEIGKTTLLTFIQSILFGFASARGDEKFQQYKPKNGSNYGGELQFVDKNNITWIVRRVDGKNGGDVTIYRGDQQVPETLITQITGGFTKEDFVGSHVLNDTSIMSIYKLNEEQLETEIMAVGAVGSKEWLLTADSLEKSSEEIYKARGRKQPLIERIEEHDKLVKHKSEFENQQVAYEKSSKNLELANKQYADNTQNLKKITEQRDELSSLNKKWSKFVSYRELSQVDVSLSNPISRNDWDQSLQLDQELQTLRQNMGQVNSFKLDDEDKEFRDYYQANKDDLDYLNAQKSTIRDLQFQQKNLNQQLNDNDVKIDSLYASNRNCDDNMQLLTEDELLRLNTPKTTSDNSRNLNWPIIGLSLVALVLATFMSGALRIGAGLIFVAGILYAWHENQQTTTTTMHNNDLEFLDKKGYKGLSVPDIQALQNVIRQLQDLNAEQDNLEKLLHATDAKLDQWKSQLNDFGLLDSSDNLSENIEHYFSRLSAINTKLELMEKNNLENKQLQQNKLNQISDLQIKLNNILKRYSMRTTDDLMRLHSEQLQKRGIINKLEQDREILGDDIELLSRFSSETELQNKLDSIEREFRSLSQQNNDLNRQIGSIKTKREQIFNNTEYQKLIDDIAQNETDMIELYDEWLADKLASKWIHSMLDLATENRYPKMLKRAAHYFELLTNGNYIDILFDSNSLKLTRRDKVEFDVHELSKATTVQLYISLRLAFVIEISDLVDLPILIDDAFVDFDRIRTNSIFELIKEVSADNQVIYVTANLNTELPGDHIINLEEVSND